MLGILIGLGVLFAWRHGVRRNGRGDSAEAHRRAAVREPGRLGGCLLRRRDHRRGARETVRSVPALAVIARAQLEPVPATAPSHPRRSARELGAEYLLTATVRWEKTPVDQSGAGEPRAGPGRAEARRPTRWQQPFEASLTDVFQVQADIATRWRARSTWPWATVRAASSRPEPTANLAAYDAFLKGEAASQAMGEAIRRVCAGPSASTSRRWRSTRSSSRPGPSSPGHAHPVCQRTPSPELAAQAGSGGARPRPRAGPARGPAGAGRLLSSCPRWITGGPRDCRGRARAGAQQRRTARRGGPGGAIPRWLGCRAPASRQGGSPDPRSANTARRTRRAPCSGCGATLRRGRRPTGRRARPH